VNWRFGGTLNLNFSGSKNKQGACHLLSRWLPAWLNIRRWRWRRYIPPKRRFTQRTTQRCFPQGITLHNHRCEDIKYIYKTWLRFSRTWSRVLRKYVSAFRKNCCFTFLHWKQRKYAPSNRWCGSVILHATTWQTIVLAELTKRNLDHTHQNCSSRRLSNTSIIKAAMIRWLLLKWPSVCTRPCSCLSLKNSSKYH
jgi:hypothetical protein